MSKNVSLLKGKVVIEGKISGPEQEFLIEKYKTKKVFEIWRSQLKELSFLKNLPNIEVLSLINTKVEDSQALSQIGTLKNLFLNEFKPGSGWDFLAGLSQIEELQILNTRGELALPDLQKLGGLKIFRLWGCKGFTDISILNHAPNLEEVELIDTGLSPADLLFLFERPNVKYLNASFKTKKENDTFQEYLDRYGKKAFRESA